MTLFNDFMSLIYPRRCEACEKILIEHEKFLCLQCLVNLPKAADSIESGEELYKLFAGRVPVELAIYLYGFEKSGKVQNLIHAIKYQSQTELASFLGEQLALLILEQAYSKIDYIVPIPLHDRKLKSRGYNQSEYFANGISKILNKPILKDNLIRNLETTTQTKKKKYQRWQNVEGIFSLKDPALIENKHVLLVDDVITTGATIESAWQTFLAIKEIRISVAAIAFAKKV